MVVRFIATGKNLRLTVGNEYVVQHATNTRYYVTNDSGSVQPYDVRLFEVVEEAVAATPVEEAPAPVRRGPGRPRTTPQQEPVETAAQRRAREAREAQQRLEEARIEEERVRGRLLTEQDRIDSIEVVATTAIPDYSGHTAGSRINVTVSYETKERLNDRSSRRSVSTFVNIFKDDCFSCGIKTMVGLQSFISGLRDLPDYQQEDFENLKEAIITRSLRTVIETAQATIRTAITICSVTQQSNTIGYLQEVGFTTSIEPVRNPNSSNNIALMTLVH